MPNYNHVCIIGHLVRDPELKYSGLGTAVCSFSIAVNRSVKRGGNLEKEVSYFDCVCFNKTAENVSQYLSKGKAALVEGELVQNRWETSEGQKRSKIEINAYKVLFLSGKGESEGPADPPIAEQPMSDGDIPF